MRCLCGGKLDFKASMNVQYQPEEWVCVQCEGRYVNRIITDAKKFIVMELRSIIDMESGFDREDGNGEAINQWPEAREKIELRIKELS